MGDAMKLTDHLLDNDTFGVDADGWWWARCSCGGRVGPFASKESVVDALMGHAYRMGQRALWPIQEGVKG